MGTYANETTVSVEKSRNEVERTLVRYGADEFAYAWKSDQAIIGFRIEMRRVKILLPLPSKEEREFTHHSRGFRTPEAAQKEWEQACRQRWRALALVVKAKLEAVESGISTVEREFLADVMLPNGQTVGEYTLPQIESAYASGTMPRLLPSMER